MRERPLKETYGVSRHYRDWSLSKSIKVSKFKLHLRFILEYRVVGYNIKKDKQIGECGGCEWNPNTPRRI
jgi:hypothetical protein